MNTRIIADVTGVSAGLELGPLLSDAEPLRQGGWTLQANLASIITTHQKSHEIRDYIVSKFSPKTGFSRSKRFVRSTFMALPTR